TPYLFPFSQTLLTDYFLAIADTAERPVYLYDLPAVCHVSIDMDTYVRLAKHPNIYGAKISGRASFARQLIDRLGDTFRVIVAEPELLDVLLRHRVMEHLDGMFAIAPQWVMALGHAAMEQDWATAADYQQKITSLRNVLAGASSDMGAFTAMMNARGISGTFHPRPFQALTDIEKVALVSHPAMVELIGNAQRATVPEAKTFNAPAVR
ncbi:MAG TPA: dihydrodipicolinate synthase family protein, partial [Tepidisphaeraceae bacterium]|nr:dihydrodipicolinate synthase family protein [Tepidisphaeraceae bacterium]